MSTTITTLVGLFCSFNLLLTLMLIRRVREHGELLAEGGAGRFAVPDDAIPSPGDAVGHFLARTTDGSPVTTSDIGDDTVVGFFAPDCAPCRENLPRFVEWAGSVRGDTRVLAVVLEAGTGTREMADALSPVARVVTEGPEGALGAAFKVRAYPSYVRVRTEGGALLVDSAGSDLASVASPVHAV